MIPPIGGPALTLLLELDPNVVKPGWTPLLLLVGMALVVALLFRSMKRQFRRVHANFPERGAAAGGPAADDTGGLRPDPDADGAAATPGADPTAGATREERAPGI